MRAVLIIFAASVFAGCTTNTGQAVSNNNSAEQPMRAEKLQSTTVHTTEGQPTPTGTVTDADAAKGGKWSASGNPIDTEKYDKAIAAAESELKKKPADEKVKAAAAEAYFQRGFALTEARQYASALGDYRRALKLVPGHAESKKWEQQIIGIYEMMKKEYPPPGREPDPLPFKKTES